MIVHFCRSPLAGSWLEGKGFRANTENGQNVESSPALDGCILCFVATDKQRLQDTLASTFMQATEQDMGFSSRPQACLLSKHDYVYVMLRRRALV